MWQQSWCDMRSWAVTLEYIVRIKIRAKSVFTKFGFWAHNLLLNCPLAYPVQVHFDSHISETFCCLKYSFSQFWTVFPSLGREKQVYPSLSHFGGQKQVLDGKNPTLLVRSVLILWTWAFRAKNYCEGNQCAFKVTISKLRSTEHVHRIILIYTLSKLL